MNRLMVHIKKELMEALRTKKIMVLAVLALFFALLDPVMLKMTPYILKEISGVDIGGLIEMSQRAELVSFHQDIYQMYTIVLVIIVSNLWLGEIKQQTIIMPLIKGAKISRALTAKMIAYTMITFIILFISYGINYYYAGVLFEHQVVYSEVVYVAFLVGLFYAWCISYLLILSVLTGNNLSVIVIGLATIFAGPFLTNLLKADQISPFTLLDAAGKFSIASEDTIILTVVCTLAIIAITQMSGIYFANMKQMVKYK